MKNRISEQLISALKAAGVDFFVSVPCKLLSGQIQLLEGDSSISYLPVTREEEGFGICAGAHLGGLFPCILMQDSGLGNSVNAIKSLIQFFQIPIVMLMSYRGSPGEPVPAQAPMGWLTPELLRLMQIPVLHCHHRQDIADIGPLVSHAWVTQSPVAILIDFNLMEQN
ncbi:MAG: sulfopyruvate decarboxylase subunit alpha [Acidiferrobacteraceae bacterium]|nr:sulfopyruvate decarboxylase subunit alpha [Acidiferrobacteraceae bacterium]|tara:strand:- start:685 stop:1188 length:504 start_codon:yes stop_codon:yes gene_type:complete